MQIGMCQNVTEDVEQRTKQASQPTDQQANSMVQLLATERFHNGDR